MIRFVRTVWRDFWAVVLASYEKERAGSIEARVAREVRERRPGTPGKAPCANGYEAGIARTLGLSDTITPASDGVHTEALRVLRDAEEHWGIKPRVH